MGWMWLGGPLLFLLFCGLLFLGWTWTSMAGSPPARSEGDDPETILKQRYARGELDQDEYEEKLADLRH